MYISRLKVVLEKSINTTFESFCDIHKHHNEIAAKIAFLHCKLLSLIL
ncbi:hypothetical protein GLIP_2813 [Aliiglaciecola lipolytica E3]|uniref:Uncharacterized protein n=1 Tax=Aliiglaciecola lipolytica E3 TaxID=1127673 RepID=K6X486_9ALTE|nr:hypothetical protein GLIP_2813 [Aliiglaciecola lipolytica E3]